MMKAAVYTEFGGPIQVRDVQKPQLLDDDSILVQVKATGVCRSDWHGWKGHDADIRNHGLPFIPGHEFSGVAVEIGSKISVVRVGDRVVAPFILSCGNCTYCAKDRPTICQNQQQPGFTYWGSFAEYVLIPRANRNVHVIPENVSFVQAAALGCRFTTAYRAVIQQGRLQPHETVVIFGCGGVGLSCVMIAAAARAQTIVAVDVSEAALGVARSLGATHTIRANSDATLLRERVIKLYDGDGADVSIDAAGFASTCENAVYCTKPGLGRMVQVGLPIDNENPPKVPMGFVAAKEIQMIGSHGFAGNDMPHLLQWIAESKIDPGKLVHKEVSLIEGAQAIQDMDHGSPLGITMITMLHESKL